MNKHIRHLPKRAKEAGAAKPDIPELRKAINYASRLLKVRLRSEEELLARLRDKKFSSVAIGQVVSLLKKSGYLDDFNFAVRWVAQRIEKPLGFLKLRYELRQKGVNKKIIDSVIFEAGKNYSEYDVISDLVRNKFRRIMPGKIDYKERRRIEGFLLRRGFSPDVVADVINSL